MSNKKLNL